MISNLTGMHAKIPITISRLKQFGRGRTGLSNNLLRRQLHLKSKNW
jgi:hypothetical protein